MLLPERWIFHAHVIKVVDGDTLKLDVDLGFRHWIRSENYRLARINAPETRGSERELGLAARDWVIESLGNVPESSVLHPKVQIHSSKHGKYRWVIEVYYGHDFNLNLSDEMVKAGHAVYVDY